MTSVCRENGAPQHRWSLHRRHTNRVCIEPALAGTRRIATGRLETRLSRPGASTDSVPPARSSPRRFAHRQLSAGWLRGAVSATGRLLGSTHRATLHAATPTAHGSPEGSPIAEGLANRLASRGRFAGSSPPAPGSPEGSRLLAARRPSPRPRCSARHTGRMLLNTSGRFLRRRRRCARRSRRSLACSSATVRFGARGAGSASWVVSIHREHVTVP